MIEVLLFLVLLILLAALGAFFYYVYTRKTLGKPRDLKVYWSADQN